MLSCHTRNEEKQYGPSYPSAGKQSSFYLAKSSFYTFWKQKTEKKNCIL